MTHDIGAHYLEDVTGQFRIMKRQADRAAAQLSDDQFFATIDPESNSVAVIMQHVGGNLRSRWTDFLTTDGEKPDRNRDGEFVIAPGATRQTIVDRWELGWSGLLGTLESLTPGALLGRVLIRTEPHTVVQAIHRALWHTGGHVGQIVFLAKHLRGEAWQTLSIPRGQSALFNEKMRARGPDDAKLSWR